MIVTITQYDKLGEDGKSKDLPVGFNPLASQARTTAGAFTAMNPKAKFARVASDTAMKLTDGAGNVMFFPANSPEYIGVLGGTVFTLATV